MQYGEVRQAHFLERPNRFIAHVELEGETVVCHVKNTGRCRELLVRGATVYLERGTNPARRTAWDLIAVEKGHRLINMDAQAPNRVFEEWARGGGFLPELSLLRPETTYRNSRFDFYWESSAERGFVEVKGVTLEEDGVVRFPDAPTLRGVKHLQELEEARRAGYRTAVCFVIQMENVSWFEPNDRTHPAFGAALRHAAEAGVEVLAMECRVTPEELLPGRPVPVRL